MTTLPKVQDFLTPSRVRSIRRGLEKESLRVLHTGKLATSSHPPGLGSALTHPHITTDFSESQLELITGVHANAQSCQEELEHIQQFTLHALNQESQESQEMLWVSSMPCLLPQDDAIPLGQYGSSNQGRIKTVYRMGLGHRYGRRMQTISGIHYNWSLPDLGNEAYFGLIRNFRRHAFLLLYLFGASPAVCSCFVDDRPHPLQQLSQDTLYLPHATSLRMGRLGYQSDAQASLAVSYNSLGDYANALQDALTQPYPAYAAIGVRAPDGAYRQLSTSLLQIENEFYGTIRPKRVLQPNERPLHALRERGVEYVEVRLMDLDPFEPVGISSQTMRFLDVFLLHCLLSESPPDTPEENAALARNQHRTAERGREPGLQLERGGSSIALQDWGLALVEQLMPIAQQLDAVATDTGYCLAVQSAQRALQNPETLPSARVLDAIRANFNNSFADFAVAQSLATKKVTLDKPLLPDVQAHLRALAQASLEQQRRIEAAASQTFDEYLQAYLAPASLIPATFSL